MMTSSEAARKRSMTGMPDKPAALGSRGRRPGSCAAPRDVLEGKETLEDNKTSPDRLDVMQKTKS